MAVGIYKSGHYNVMIEKVLMTGHVTSEQVCAGAHIDDLAIGDCEDLVFQHALLWLHGDYPAGMQQGIGMQHQKGQFSHFQGPV